MSEEKKVWTNDEIQILISIYEEYPVLWDVRSPGYRNRIKKQDALLIIANKFNTDVNEITRKLHNLRSQFMQEVKKIKIKKSGAGSDEVYISNWPYFSAMKFIQHSVDNSETTDNMNLNLSQTERNVQEPGPSEFHRREPNSTPRKKRLNNDSCGISSEDIMKKAASLLNQPTDNEQIFGDYVASEIRQLNNPENKRKLRRLINEAIMQISDMDTAEQKSPKIANIILSSPTYSTYSSSQSSTPLPSPYQYDSETPFTETYSSSQCTTTDLSDISFQQL